MASTFFESFKERSEATPELPGLLAPGKSQVTIGQLFEQTLSSRERLINLGVRRGSRVGVLCPTRDSMAACHLAILTLATSAPLSANAAPMDLESAITNLGLDFVVLEKGLDDLRRAASAAGASVLELNPDTQFVGQFELSGEHTEPALTTEFPGPGDIAMVLQTSGTTARPKIVPRSQQRLVSNLCSEHGETRLRPRDRVLNTLPLHHSEGLFQLMMPLVLGASVVLAEFRPADFIGMVERYQPTKFTLVPSMHRMVVSTVAERRAVLRGSSVRFVETSSAALSLTLRKQMEQVYGVPIIEGYGATEVGGIADMGLSQRGVPPDSVGKRRHEGVVIMDEEGNVVAPMVQGEICVKGPATITEYENDPDATAAAFRNGYYRTGDQGYLDENDYLFVLGRVTDTINRGGEKIAPAEIDRVLLEHPDVEQAAAFGVEHAVLGQEVWAAVIPKPGANPNPSSIRSHAARSLSFPRVPKKIIVTVELPHNEMGKIVRRDLSRQFNPEGISPS